MDCDLIISGDMLIDSFTGISGPGEIAISNGSIVASGQSLDGYKAAVEAEITQTFDPPLYDKSKERVAKSHYFQKDFKAFKLGTLRLKKGKGLLRLTAPKIVGTGAIDVYSIRLDRK